jgi:hypothetical protein
VAIKGTILFCDDVREETGNKSSYMGVYGPSIQIPADGSLARLWVCALLDVEDERSIDVVCSIVSDPPAELPKNIEANIPNATPEERRWSVKMHFALQGLPLKIGQTLSVTVNASGAVFEQTLEVRSAPSGLLN